MKPLLEIQSVPISIEYKIANAKIQRAESVPATARAKAVQPRREKAQGQNAGGPPQRIKQDTYEFRRHRAPRIEGAGTGMRANVRFYDGQGNSHSAAYEATARLGKGGQVMVDLQLQSAQQEAASPMAESQFIEPSASIEQSLPQSLSLTYQMEKMQYEMRQQGEGFEFTPASIEFSVKEYPRVVIEYLGSPMYVPPSADPDYEPIDTIV